MDMILTLSGPVLAELVDQIVTTHQHAGGHVHTVRIHVEDNERRDQASVKVNEGIWSYPFQSNGRVRVELRGVEL